MSSVLSPVGVSLPSRSSGALLVDFILFFVFRRTQHTLFLVFF
nr:MAG: hypothetical protein ADFBMEEK_00093 [Peromyscus leucopus gammaherpesvirus]